jgi:hypothetical protein
MTNYFRESNGDLAPLFENLLSIGVEFRVAGSKSVGLALMQPLRCPECSKPLALVILGLPFMLLLFRLQSIFVSMIDQWEIIPEANNTTRERISWHEAGETQVRQLVLGLEMYLGDQDVTFEGLGELLQGLDASDPHAKRSLLDALRLAESWVVAHEFFHACLLANNGGPFQQFATILESNQEVTACASQYCDQVTKRLGLQTNVAKEWLEEFQADILACKMLVIAIADRRFGTSDDLNAPAKDVRFHSARAVLNGAAAAFEAIFWVDVQRKATISQRQLQTASHPPSYLRWELISKFTKALIDTTDDSLFKTTELVALLSSSLARAYQASRPPLDRIL